jgi:hypothetical protein
MAVATMATGPADRGIDQVAIIMATIILLSITTIIIFIVLTIIAREIIIVQAL